jgi:hypothetical protein
MMSQEARARRSGGRRRRFYFASACVIAALIVLSFAQSYFFPLATASKSFRLLRHLHGLAFFAFTALFVWQAWLIRSQEVARHREWGTAGAALAGMMLALGIWLAIVAVEDRVAQGFARPFELALYNVVDIALFCGLIGWSIREAFRRVDWHRRLAFAAMLNLLGPAWSRWVLQMPYGFPWLDMTPNLLADLGLVALAWHDRRKRGRIHTATIIAAAVIAPVHFVEPWVARSDWWSALAPHLFGFS